MGISARIAIDEARKEKCLAALEEPKEYSELRSSVHTQLSAIAVDLEAAIAAVSVPHSAVPEQLWSDAEAQLSKISETLQVAISAVANLRKRSEGQVRQLGAIPEGSAELHI